MIYKDNQNWEVFVEIPVGIWKEEGIQDFPEHFADCILMVDCGNGFESEYVVNAQDYIDRRPDWGEGAKYCVMNYPIRLGNLNGNSLQIKLLKINPNVNDTRTTYQTTLFDRIRVRYSKETSLDAPSNFDVALSAGTNINLTWDTDPNPSYQYKIFRDGKLIAITSDASYLDVNNEEYKTFTYSVTAFDPETENESVQRLARKSVTTIEAEFPVPADFTVNVGSGSEYNCMILNWLQPDQNVLTYEIYKDGQYINSTTNTSYTDPWLELGSYNYFITATYTTGESNPTETLSGSINPSNLYPPLFEGFENSGASPEYFTTKNSYWSYDTANPFLTVTPQPVSGDYLAYIGVSGLPQLMMDELISPIFDLSAFKDIEISYRYLVNIQNNFMLSQNTKLELEYVDNLSTTHSLHLDEWNTDYNTTEWQEKAITVPDNILTDNSKFIIRALVDVQDFMELKTITIDDINIQGTVAIDPPSRITLQRYQNGSRLDWDPVTNATQYVIYRSNKANDNYEEIGISSFTTFFDNDANLEDGVYFYKIVSESTQKILPNATSLTKEVK